MSWVSIKGLPPAAPRAAPLPARQIRMRGITRMSFLGALSLMLAIWAGVACGIVTAWEIDRRLHPEAYPAAGEDWRAP